MPTSKDKLSKPPEQADAGALRERERATKRRESYLRDALTSAEARADTAEKQLAAVLDLERAESFVKPIRPLKAAGKGKPEATYFMMASDWHVGERVRPNMVSGCNEYTPEIAQERAEHYFRNNLKVLNALRSTWDVKTLVWWLGGDFVTGWIHDDLVYENYLSPQEEAKLAYKILLGGARFILEHYDVDRIIIPTSSGNHGRSTEKKHTSDFRTSSEFLMYGMLEMALESEKRVEIKLGHGYENHQDIYGYRIACHHGDEVKGGIGVGGVAPSLYRRIQRVGAGAFARDLDVYGHHHQLSFAPAAFGNGSLIGYNAYAAAKGFRPEPPQQGSFLIDAQRRVPVAMTPIFVTK